MTTRSTPAAGLRNAQPIFELYRRQAEQLRAEREATQPTQTKWAPGSMEWLAEAGRTMKKEPIIRLFD